MLLPITTCTVTKNNGKLLFYSIQSIVNHISEILIFDDTTNEYDRNPCLDELVKYENVKIFNTKEFGKDLGKKKQYLVDNAVNDIVMRWDDDFILYNLNLLTYIYKELTTSELDTIVTLNPNFAFTLDYVRPVHNFCGEIYLYKKHIIKFGKLYGFCDFPIKRTVNRIDIDRMLFLHFWNFKSYENMYFREYMSQYLCDETYNSYDEFCYVNEFPSKKYDFNIIIEYKKQKIKEYQTMQYNFNKDVNEFKKQFDLSILDNQFVDYIQNNYKINDVFSKNSKLFRYETIITNNLIHIFYEKDGNIGNMMSYYLFEKGTGFIHTLSNINENHFLITSIMNENSIHSIVWGSGLKNETDPFYFSNVYCVNGPHTKKIIESNTQFKVNYYGNPILLMSLFYKSEITKTKFDLAIVVNNYTYKQYQQLQTENVHIINSRSDFTSYHKIELFIDMLHNYKVIFTNVRDVVILCHSYNIPVVYFNDNSFDTDFMIKDYFDGVYELNKPCITNYKQINLIKYSKTITNVYKPPLFIKERQMDLIKSCPFIDEGLKPLLLKRV